MLIADPHDPDGLSAQAAAERARLALRAASVRFSTEPSPASREPSPFSIGTALDDGDQLFAG